MIIRTPTRTKTKSFKGDQMDFKFPGGYPHDSDGVSSQEEKALNNHYLVNESLKSDHERADELITSVVSSTTTHSSRSKPNNINADSSNGYYSFANISDNTTSPSFLHHRDSSESNDDMISMVHINSQYPHTLAPKKNGNDTTNIESTDSSPSPQKKQSTRSLATHTNTIPTADNMSFDIISSDSLYRVSSAKLESLRLPSSSSSSNISSRASLLHGSATVKRTPMNLYRKPTMRKIESVIFSSDASEASDNGVPNPLLNKNTNVATATAPAAATTAATAATVNKSRIPTKQVHSKINKTKDLPSKPIRRMSSMRASPKSNLKRSNAIRCHGGLLQYFEMIGIQIKKLLKQIKLLFFKKKTTTTYQSKNFNTRRSSSFATTGPLPTSNSTLQNKRLRNGKNTTKIPKSRVQPTNKLKVSHHIPNSSSLQALQPVLIEKINPLKPNVTTSTSTTIPNGNKSQEQESNNGHKIPMESTFNSPIISGATSANLPSTRTNSTLRRTNSSIRRAASILTASSPSTTTYYSTMTHPENDSPMRRSKLIKSNGSTSLNSLVRQPSIVVKNKVIPLSMSQYSSSHDIGENDMDSKINGSVIMEEHEGFESNRMSNKYTSPLMEPLNIDAFDTIKEEDEDDDERRNVSSESDSGSSIFMQLETTPNSMDGRDMGPVSDVSEHEEVDETKLQQEYEKRQETMRQLMKEYLSQIIQKRIMMRLQMTKFQTTDIMDDQYKQMIDNLVVAEHENANEDEDEDESDTSSVISSDNDSMKFSNYNATTDVHSASEDEEEENDKISPLSMQYPSKDIAFGMSALFASNRDKVMNIPTSTIKRSMTLPIGMKI